MSAADLFDRSSSSWFPFSHSHHATHGRHRGHFASVAPIKWVLLLCSSIALASSSYLAWVSLTSGSVAGCSGDLFNCDHVLHSRWATVMSIPVSIPAILTHASILGLLLLRPMQLRWERYRWPMISFAALTAGAAALWFVGLQVFLLEHLCPYCLVAHAAGLVAAVAVLWRRPLRKSTLAKVSGAAVTSVALLIALQVSTPAPDTFEVIEHTTPPAAIPAETTLPAESTTPDSDSMLFEAPISSTSSATPPAKTTVTGVSLALGLLNPSMLMMGQVDQADGANTSTKQPERRTASILGGLKLDTRQWPLIGKPDAELVFVELFDYTCPHCQRTHGALSQAKARYGDRLAVIVLPVPLDRSCNPTVRQTGAAHAEACDLARLAISVWVVDPKAFPKFHDYVFDNKPNYATALQHASQVVDSEKLRETMSGPIPSDYIAKHVSLYKRAGEGAIPKLLFPTSTTVGEVASADRLIQLISQHLERASR
ncbi:suppressor for copper-sensitivity C-like protein [Rhodopirellula maiorica SM1]|uniref:Suppressor for copper-sensitivity C-like protein n=1 Tax=Rhodopirellula maiorica SM1 TaxID=1265738 RepID=M5RNT6_9BACT|nr:vitamin K epoxide reductase family protein [Rhodopirellula maiorica]EMI20960.1 suppressor for copper-sensitivity C-like protein [Rhodopirellula maiorica SM1]